jgi:hypothetical protein
MRVTVVVHIFELLDHINGSKTLLVTPSKPLV